MASSGPGTLSSARAYKRQPSVDDVLELGAVKKGSTNGSDAVVFGAGADGAELQGPGLVEEYRTYRRRWAYLAVLCLMNISISWGWLTFAAISTTAQKHYKLSSQTPINWLSTVIFLTYAVATPAVIHVLNKHSLRKGVLVCAACSAAGYWIRYAGARLAGKPGYGITLVGQILIGFAQPFVLSAPTHFSDLWFTSRGRVGATALVSLSNPLGGALGQLLGPIIADTPKKTPNLVLVVAIVGSLSCLCCVFIEARPPTPPCRSAGLPKMPLRQSLSVLAKNRGFWAILYMFVIYLGLFNALSTLINQILEPYGFTETEAGISGAVLIVVGLVGSAIVSPIIDRTQTFRLSFNVLVPLLASSYLVYYFLPASKSYAAVCVISGVIGATSFSLLPVALEFVVEQTHPVPPELTSSILWVGGQLTGAISLTAMDALKAGKSANPPLNMKTALIFQTVLACAAVPGLLLIGNHSNRRIELDKEGSFSS